MGGVGRDRARLGQKARREEEGRRGGERRKEGEGGGEERRAGKRWEGEGRGRTGNQGRKDADTARPGGACRVGSLKRFREVANTFQAAGRERRACRYFWRGAQLGWRPEAGPEARLGWGGPRGLGSACGDWSVR